jgi:hypothetical protein
MVDHMERQTTRISLPSALVAHGRRLAAQQGVSLDVVIYELAVDALSRGQGYSECQAAICKASNEPAIVVNLFQGFSTRLPLEAARDFASALAQAVLEENVFTVCGPLAVARRGSAVQIASALRARSMNLAVALRISHEIHEVLSAQCRRRAA